MKIDRDTACFPTCRGARRRKLRYARLGTAERSIPRRLCVNRGLALAPSSFPASRNAFSGNALGRAPVRKTGMSNYLIIVASPSAMIARITCATSNNK